jgi:hypothetical protein
MEVTVAEADLMTGHAFGKGWRAGVALAPSCATVIGSPNPHSSTVSPTTSAAAALTGRAGQVLDTQADGPW